MTILRMLEVAVVAAIAVTGSAARASEPDSFIERVMQGQGITPSGAEAGNMTASAVPTQSSYGEPASFISRVEKSQGIAPLVIESRGTAVAATQGSYGEPASFIARVAKSQGIMLATPERQDQLSPEQIRLVQRALTARGYSTPVSGKFDERTRSALMSFQKSQSLAVSGTLDSKTVDALGFAPTQVAPVRGRREDNR